MKQNILVLFMRKYQQCHLTVGKFIVSLSGKRQTGLGAEIFYQTHKNGNAVIKKCLNYLIINF